MEGRFLDVLVVVIYLIGMLVIGYIAQRKSKNSNSFFAADRNLGYLMFIPCLSALLLGGSSTLTSTRLGYEFGIGAIMLVGTMCLGIIAVNAIFGPYIIKYKLTSIGEVVGLRFGKTSSTVLSIIQVLFCFFLSVVQVVAIGALLSSLLGWNPIVAMIVGGLVGIVYSSIGGMLAVTFTDTVQWVVLMVGAVLIFMPMALFHAGGIGALTTALPPAHFDIGNIGWSRIISFFMLYALGFLVDQSQWQRTATAKNTKIAIRGAIIAAIVCMVYAVSVTIIGMCGAVLMPGIEDPQSIFGQMLLAYLPAGLGGLVIAGCLSAIMSTMSGPLLAAGTVIVHDIVKSYIPHMEDHKELKLAKIIVFSLGILAICVALFFRDILVVLDFTYSLLTGGMLIPVIAAVFWKRCTSKAAIASMLFSTVAMLLGFLKWGVGPWQPILLGVIVGFIIIVIVSLLTKPEDKNLQEIIEKRLEDENIEEAKHLQEIKNLN